jgi:multicomponent Na+:H+ antiporter subunit F
LGALPSAVGVMADFLRAATVFVLAMVALGLLCILRGPSDADRMMAAQLFGSGGIAALLLFEVATGLSPIIDVALTLAVLAAFASLAFVNAGMVRDAHDKKKTEPPR